MTIFFTHCEYEVLRECLATLHAPHSMEGI